MSMPRTAVSCSLLQRCPDWEALAQSGCKTICEQDGITALAGNVNGLHPCCKPSEKAVWLPGWRRVCVRNPQRKFFEKGVELRGCSCINGLRGVVLHTVVALFVPIVEQLFFRSAGQPTEF